MPTRSVTTTSYGADGKVTGTTTTTVEISAAQDNLDTITNNALVALGVNRTFLALPSLTNAQLSAQVQALTRQNVRLIRLVLGLLDGTD